MGSDEHISEHVSVLDKNLPKLVDNIDITTGRLWDHMVSYGVVQRQDVKDIRVCNFLTDTLLFNIFDFYSRCKQHFKNLLTCDIKNIV